MSTANTVIPSFQGKIPNQWLLDTGATDHITFHFNNYISHHNIKPVCITLPNSFQDVTSIAGTVKISNSLLLHNVLYVPSFHVNLIYVTRLLLFEPCYLTFTNSSCIIIQSATERMISSANL